MKHWRLMWKEPRTFHVDGEAVDAIGIGKDEAGSFLVIDEDGGKHRVAPYKLSSADVVWVNLEFDNFPEARETIQTKRQEFLVRLTKNHLDLFAGQEIIVRGYPVLSRYVEHNTDEKWGLPMSSWPKVTRNGWCRFARKKDGKEIGMIPEHKLEVLEKL